MRFSIVIPVYNVADYLPKCIDSVLENDCSDCEIILVDDGSTDKTSGAVCDSYAARHPQRIRVIHQENQGLGGARNTGLEAARGEYLFFVDSDDYIAPQSLQILSAAIDKTHASIYSFQAVSHDGAGAKTPVAVSPVYAAPFSLREQPEFLFSLPAAWARIWRRELFLKTGVRYPTKVWYEDIRTSTKLFALADSIVTLPDCLYFYLARPGSIMRSGTLARNREIFDAFDDILSWFQARQLYSQYEDALCRLAVEHILLAGTVRVAKIDPRASLLPEFSAYMDVHFSKYRHNPYLSSLSKPKRLALFLAQHRCYRLLQILFRNR